MSYQTPYQQEVSRKIEELTWKRHRAMIDEIMAEREQAQKQAQINFELMQCLHDVRLNKLIYEIPASEWNKDSGFDIPEWSDEDLEDIF